MSGSTAKNTANMNEMVKGITTSIESATTHQSEPINKIESMSTFFFCLISESYVYIFVVPKMDSFDYKNQNNNTIVLKIEL